MGLAASQTRFLQLTARKSNVEYQGQQINHQRLTLANQSSGLLQQQLALEVPTPPTSSSSNYIKYSYSYTDAQDSLSKKISFTTDSNGNVVGATVTYEYNDANGDSQTSSVNVQTGAATASGQIGIPSGVWATDSVFDSSGRLTSINLSTWDDDSSSAVTTTYSGSDLSYTSEFNNLKYDDDMNAYDYSKAIYDSKLDLINAQTAELQAQDRTLELRMKQLDTEHTAIQNELESVQKVIQTNVESSYKTFGS